MNYKLLLIFILLINTLFVFSEDKTKDKKLLIKRTIAILPFYNQNDIKEYNYLADTMRDSLKVQLLKSENLIITNFARINNEIKKINLKTEELVSEENAKDIAFKSKSDIVIIGKYIIIQENIMVQIDALDIFTGQIVASSNIKGDVGLDIFRIIDDITKDMADKLLQKLPMVDKTYFDEMMNVRKKNELKKKNKIIFNKELNNFNKAGIGLVSGGSAMLLTGIIIFTVDNTYIMNKRDSLYNQSYSDYLNYYNIDVAMFSCGLTLMICGIIMDGVSIPLLVYKKKNVSFIIEPGNEVKMYFSYRF